MIAVCQQARIDEREEVGEEVWYDAVLSRSDCWEQLERYLPAWPLAAAMWRTELPLSSSVSLNGSDEKEAMKCCTS